MATRTCFCISKYFYFALVLLESALHMVSCLDAQEEININSNKLFKLDHEYLERGLIPSRDEDDLMIKRFGLAGTLNDIKIELHGATHQCFHQDLKKGFRLYIYFQVIKGADKNINVDVIRPDGRGYKTFEWTQQGAFDDNVPIDGIYTICLDNSMSRFSNKIVHIYLVSFYEEEWRAFSDSYDMYAQNFSSSFEIIDKHVKVMLPLVTMDSEILIRDWYTIKESNKYVQNLSIFMCILIVVTMGLQVFFVRRLFSQPNPSRPRL